MLQLNRNFCSGFTLSAHAAEHSVLCSFLLGKIPRTSEEAVSDVLALKINYFFNIFMLTQQFWKESLVAISLFKHCKDLI